MSTEWETPQRFFDELNKEFHFTLDVCALPGTAKCFKYFTPGQDALIQDWSKDTFWMNPPYGRGQNVYQWVRKAYFSTLWTGTGVCLLPASTDTKWFHEFCLKASEIRFIKDRLWFSLNGTCQRANHASIVVVFGQNGSLKISTISNMRTITQPQRGERE